jgi:diacylglycerol kinase (ATP)
MNLENPWPSNGARRLARAIRHQAAGIRFGLSHDSAIRQVTIAFLILAPVAILLPATRLERLLLLLSLMFVVVVEYVNSAVEACVNRISMESHPLSRQAKDYASVAVGGAALMSGLCWAVIAGPILLNWLSRTKS